MKTLLGLAISVIALTACDPFQGMLQVSSPMTVTSDDTNPNCDIDSPWGCNQTSVVKIPVGGHSASLEMLNKTQMRIVAEINGKKQTMNLDIPASANLPTENGDFALSSSQIQQNFAARGSMATTVTNSDVVDEMDSCTISQQQTVCDVINNQQVCHQVVVNYPGRQEVQYYTKYTHQDFHVSFVTEASNAVLGVFTGARDSSQRIYTYQGPCLP